MPYTNTGSFVPVSGSESAAPGQIIASAIWNNIFTDMAGAFSQLGSGGVPTVSRANTAALGASVRPSPLGNWNSISTAFTGNSSALVRSVGYSITGNTTLSQPNTGYVITQEATPDIVYLFTSSGWNQSNTSNDGRTAAMARYTKVDQYGLGDCIANYVAGFCANTNASATNFLANPAIGAFAADMQAGNTGVYLNPVEINCEDKGFDVAGIAYVTNLSRTNNAGGLGVWWSGLRVQSVGTQPIDTIIGGYGLANFGLDLSYFNFGANSAAITLSQGQKIYMNALAVDSSGSKRFPQISNTSAFVVSGSGSPVGSLVGGKGSVYMNLSGSNTANRMYINTDSNSTWVGVITTA